MVLDNTVIIAKFENKIIQSAHVGGKEKNGFETNRKHSSFCCISFHSGRRRAMMRRGCFFLGGGGDLCALCMCSIIQFDVSFVFGHRD